VVVPSLRQTLRAEDLVILDKRITADEPLTLQQLADELNMSREQVRRLEVAMMQRLRDFLRPPPAA
jgi:RNA polymerase sigma-32 factor